MAIAQSSLDAAAAAALAAAAGQLLLDLRASSGHTGKELGRLGDRCSNELLLAELAAEYPDDAVLSEESADSPARLSADRVWIIDPLDGTREYGMAGRNDWAVHVALWERTDGDDVSEAGRVSAAAVAQPALNLVYDSESARELIDRPAAGDRRRRFLVSDSRPPAWAAPVADALDADLASMGSAGAKAMAVLRGEADAYLHSGGQWEWDSAAPVGVVRAAGLHASRIDGTPLVYNQPHPYLPDLVICRQELAIELLDAIGTATGLAGTVSS